MQPDSTALIFMYFVMPIRPSAGFASNLEETTGAKASLIHLMIFTEVGIALLAAFFLEIIASMFVILLLDEAALLFGLIAVISLHWGQTLRRLPMS